MKKDTNKVKKDKKIHISKENSKIIIIILMIIAIIVIGTYALSLWTSSENTELTMRIGSVAEVVFETGNDINVSNIGPVFDPEKDGEITNFSVINFTSEEVPVVINLSVTSISNNLKNESFKYVLMSSTDNVNYTKVKEGNFVDVNNGETISLHENYNLPINNGVSFKVIFYIDGNMLNDNSIQGGSLNGYISVRAGGADIEINNMPIPTDNYYTVDTSVCTDGGVIYDYTKKTFEVHNYVASVNCTPIVTPATKTYLASYIKDTLTGKTQGDGQVVNENGYRYEGKNPNNYIIFNDELWRIIGVFDSAAHGQSGQYLTKIIREESIGALSWDVNNKNNWPTSSLYNLLNSAYYNADDGTNSGYCYCNSTTPGICDYRVKGIQDAYRPMVKNVTWYLGGYNDSGSVNVSTWYNYERTTSAATAYYPSGNARTVNALIGLIYFSDYGYSMLASSCPRSTTFLNYSSAACSGSSWLKKEQFDWTISPHTGTLATVVYVSNNGNSTLADSNSSRSVNPVLYLDSSVFIIKGEGSMIDPYIIGIN